MNIGEAEIWLRQKLATIYDESEAANIASLVMEHLTGLNRLNRLTRKEVPLAPAQLQQLNECQERLLQHEPVQYIIEEAWFYEMKLFVDRHVLIPRPETEELVDWIVNDLKDAETNVFVRMPFKADATDQLKILDVGTGSGCIALALKKTMPRAEVWGCDVSDEALNIARRNGSELDIRVDFVALDFLDHEQVRQLPTVDIVVSNPPYIPLKDKKNMRPNVVHHEPHGALFVPDKNALLFYKALAGFGKHRLYPGGCMYMEIHEELGADVVQLFKQEGYSGIELKRDMQGKERMVKVRRASNT